MRWCPKPEIQVRFLSWVPTVKQYPKSIMKKIFVSILSAVCITNAQAYPIAPHPNKEEITWLVKNIYFEARNQGTAGRLAVMMVTINRVLSQKFPNTIKGVVTQGGKKRHRCQFSWYCDGAHDKIYDWKTYNEIEQLVLTTLPVASRINDITDGATFYHATYVKPYWAKAMKKTIQIGDHIFYKGK
jgi:N-acetylmuramoyl-L-alanine amidase